MLVAIFGKINTLLYVGFNFATQKNITLMRDLCPGVHTVQGNELRLFWGQAILLTQTIFLRT